MMTVPSLPLILLLACSPKPAAEGELTSDQTQASPTPTNLKPPGSFAGAQDRVRGVVPDALPARETIALTRSVWGVDLTATAKGIQVTYDSKTGRIFSAGHTNPAIMVTEPGAEHPSRSLEVEFSNHDVGLLTIDETRRNLFWVMRSTGSIWVFDADTLELKGTVSYPPVQGDPYPIREVTIDPATGWVWAANLPKRSLIGHSPDLKTTETIAVQTPLSLVAFGPDQILISTGPASKGGAPGTTAPGAAPGMRPGGQGGGRPGGPGMRPGAPGGAPEVGAGPKTARDRALGADTPHGMEAGEALPPGDLMMLKPSDKSVTPALVLSKIIPTGAPTQVVVGADKTLFASLGEDLAAFTLEGTLKWRVTMPGSINRLAIVGDTIGLISHTSADDSTLVLVSAADGSIKSKLEARFSSKELIPDAAHSQFLLSSSGDGSVWMVDLKGQITRKVNVGITAEKLVVDPKTGDRFILDRLGGSRIMVWPYGQPKGEAKMEIWDGGRWPTDLIIDSKRRWLLALGHFDGVVMRWDLETRKPMPPVSLGVPENAHDTLGDFDYDEASGVVVACFPESGSVVAVDLTSGKQLWKITMDGFKTDTAGPEFAAIAVDGKQNKVYLWSLVEQTVTVLSLKNGKSEKTIPLTVEASGDPRQGARKGVSSYQGGIFFLDEAGDRLFVGRYVIDLKKGEQSGTVPAEKIFYADKNTILGLRRVGRTTDVLIQIDPATLAEVKKAPLADVQFVGMQGAYDPERKTLYAIEMDRALVHVYDWPQ